MFAGEALRYLESPAKQLILLSANPGISSKWPLKSLNNQADFDSAIRSLIVAAKMELKALSSLRVSSGRRESLGAFGKRCSGRSPSGDLMASCPGFEPCIKIILGGD